MMNHSYTQIPRQVEAFQMTVERSNDNQDWPTWLHQAWQKNTNQLGCLYLDKTSKARKFKLTMARINYPIQWNDYIVNIDGVLFVYCVSTFKFLFL